MIKIIFIAFISLMLTNSIAVELPVKQKTPSDIVDKLSRKYRISPKIVRAVIHVESRGRVSAYNKRSKDYGLLQINEKNIKALGLDKKRLTTDYVYSLEQGIKILVWFKDRYESKLGDKWQAKFNCGVRKGCENTKKSKKYMRMLYAKM